MSAPTNFFTHILTPVILTGWTVGYFYKDDQSTGSLDPLNFADTDRILHNFRISPCEIELEVRDGRDLPEEALDLYINETLRMTRSNKPITGPFEGSSVWRFYPDNILEWKSFIEDNIGEDIEIAYQWVDET
ncbi:MAG: hypothetical protein HRU20_30815 [Pseudomonadales bacterium]|nr:hypothetical protein [Pseudomonadales bacterium]